MSRWTLVLSVLLAGCWASSSREVRRDSVFMMPGPGPVFVSFVDEKTTEFTSLALSKNDSTRIWDRSISTSVKKAWVVTVDPASGQPTPLAWVGGSGVPFFWDDARKILWLNDPKDHSVVGLSSTGPVYPGGQWATWVRPSAWPAPFAITEAPGGMFRIWNAATQTELSVEADRLAEDIHVDGAVLRVTKMAATTSGVIRVDQTAIDWSNPTAPVRRPDVAWQTPSLSGTRLSYTVTDDGRWFVEVVALADGNRVVVHEIGGAGQPVVTPLAVGPKAIIDRLGGSRVIIHEEPEAAAPEASDAPDAGDAKVACWRGAVLDASTGANLALSDAPCVTEVGRMPSLQYGWLGLADKHYGYVDAASGTVVDLGALDSLTQLGTTTVGFVRQDGGGFAVEQLDLATGSRRVLATRTRRPDLIHVDRDELVLLEGETIVRQQIGTATDARVELPARIAPSAGTKRAYETAGIGQRPERIKLWLGMGGGVSTEVMGALDMGIQLRRYMSPRWALAGGAGFFGSDQTGDGMYQAWRASMSVFLYRRPRLGGWYASGEAGLGASSVVRVVTPGESAVRGEHAFAPALALGIGYQGRLFEGHLTAIAPTLIDLGDRGVTLIAGFRIGLFGANR